MKLKHLITASVLTFSLAGGYAVNNWYTSQINDNNNHKTEINMPENDFDYTKAWAEVEAFQKDALPKSALAKVREIQKNALKDNNYLQLIKSNIFTIDLVKDVDENNNENDKAWADELQAFRNQAETMPTDFRHLSYNIIAKYYDRYLIDRLWKIRQRTQLENETSNDIETWSEARIQKEIHSLYQKSIDEPETLFSFPLKNYEILTKPANNITKDYEGFPTLLDYLVWNIARENHDSNSDFSYQDLALVSGEDEFISYKAQNNEQESMSNLILEGLQTLTRCHKNDSKMMDRAWTNAERIKFYRQKSTNENASECAISSLKKMREDQKDSSPDAFCLLTYHIAEILYDDNRMTESHAMASEALDSTINAPDNYREACHRIIHNIELKRLTLDCQSIVSPQDKFPARLEYTNISKLYIKVIRISNPREFNEIWHHDDKIKYLKNKGKEVNSYEINTVNTLDYQEKNSEIIFDELPIGHYVILTGVDSDIYDTKKNAITTVNEITSSNIYVVNSHEMGEKILLYVLDRKTGKPLADADVRIKLHDKNTTKASYKTDKYGAVSFPEKESAWNTRIVISTADGDEAEVPRSSWGLWGYHAPNEKTSYSDKIFTDRKIYRPGQTIYWKTICYEKTDHHTAHAYANRQRHIELLDVNSRKVASIAYTTNEFGSAYGQFSIPTNLVNGRFTLRCANGSTDISVEEYKRPKFEVSIDEIKDEVRLNENVSISGKALTYAGIQIDNAKVKYKIERMPRWRGWWYWTGDRRSKVVANGETMTDSDGKFTITFKALPDPKNAESEMLQYDFRISADVTDISGETRSASKMVSAGYRSLFLGSSLPDGFQLMDQTDLSKVTISSSNINGQHLDANVTIKVSRLANFRNTYVEKAWQSCDNPIVEREVWERDLPMLEYQKSDGDINALSVDKLLKTITINTAESKTIDLSEIKKSGSGNYLVELSATDKDGRPVRYENRFTIYNTADRITSVNKAILLHADKGTYEPGDIAHVTIATAMPDVDMRYIITDGRGMLESNMVRLNSNSSVIDIPIKESHRGNLSVYAFFVRGNTMIEANELIHVPFSNKKLNIKFETFRDRLYPGESEKWKLRITDYQQNPAMAEMLATLYDESLDALRPNSFGLGIFQYNYTVNPYSSLLGGLSQSNTFNSPKNQQYGITIRNGERVIEWYNHDPSLWRNYYANDIVVVGYGTTRRKASRSVMRESATAECLEIMDDRMEVEEMEEEAEPVFCMVDGPMMSKKASVMANVANEEGNGAEEDFSSAQIRTNFNETAFFEPQIVTDPNGELYVEFTVPESITRWKMLGLAHTKDMKTGTVENHLVTKKDFSVEPNLPRFLRSGDRITIPAKITNLTDDDQISGKVRLEILDPNSMKPVSEIQVKNPVQDFVANANKSTVCNFDIEMGDYVNPVVIKVVAISADKSDGEQHCLPVLTDRELVTESMTMSVRGGQTKQFEFREWKDNHSPSAVNHSFTLEYTSNPAWYAVTSLPWLSENPYDCYEQTYSKLFANSISGLIVENNPNIADMIATWRNSKAEVLTSPLLKNQELKQLLIEETPWAIDAKEENEQIEQLANLLDRNRINEQNSKFIKKLQKGQLHNGAWPWYDGFGPSPCITQYIATGFGKMKHMGVKLDKDVTAMVSKAIQYLDKEAVDYLNEIKRHKLEVGFYGYQFAYMRSFFPENKMDKKTKEAYDYFMNEAKKNWTKFGIHNQALLCVTFKRNGDLDLAKKIIKSFDERATRSEEFGMYFKENINGILFHEDNIATQSLIIEAYQEMGRTDEVEELKIWLIKNRQSNRWKTTKATTEAVYAMFLCGNQIQSNEPLCTITIGGNTIDTKNAEAGTGYLKQQWQKDDMDIKMADITVHNPNNHISYGAVYRQYFETLDNIKSADNKLKIEKQIFLVTQDKNGNDQLSEITGNRKLHPGDKLRVRMVIRTDRDLEYVHLKDMRPSGKEPINVLSQTKYQDGMFYYESTKDASENFFIEHLNKGTYVFEYPLVAVHAGNFSAGIATIQCMYAPEFGGHSDGMRVRIEE